MKITAQVLLDLKQRAEKITALTCYDASWAQLLDQAEIEVILVGDSLGTVIQGRSNTIAVKTNDISYHVSCVAQSLRRAWLIADLPFMSYYDAVTAFSNATQLMQAGAEMVKLEGGGWTIEIIRKLVERGIPVCGHLGLTPQSVHYLGGHKVQGRAAAQAAQIKQDALAIQAAGAQLLVLECVPRGLAAEISQELSIPVIGIGSGVATDGQILVLYDMLGLGRQYKFTHNFLGPENSSLLAAIRAYHQAVKSQEFPTLAHSF